MGFALDTMATTKPTSHVRAASAAVAGSTAATVATSTTMSVTIITTITGTGRVAVLSLMIPHHDLDLHQHHGRCHHYH